MWKTIFFPQGNRLYSIYRTCTTICILIVFFEIAGCLVLNSYKDYLFIKRDNFYFVVALGYMVSTIFGLFTLFCELPEDPNLNAIQGVIDQFCICCFWAASLYVVPKQLALENFNVSSPIVSLGLSLPLCVSL